MGELTVADVTAALERGGYTDTRLRAVHFDGFSSQGHRIYLIAYDDPDAPDKIGVGRVFIDSDGKGDF